MEENEKIYLIKRIDFDGFENNDPINESIYGYLDRNISDHDAELYVRKLENIKGCRYRGYNDKYYPKFKLEKVNKLDLGALLNNIDDIKINKSFTIKFESVQELANVLTELGLENKFTIYGPEDQHPGSMYFYNCGYGYSINPDSDKDVRIVMISETYDGDYIISEMED